MPRTKIDDMELIRYEKYDYVMIVCRNEIDHSNLTRALELTTRKFLYPETPPESGRLKHVPYGTMI